MARSEDGDGGATLVVRRATASALGWSLLGLLLVVGGLLLVTNSAGHPVAWLLLMLSVVATGWFVVQLLLPGAVALELDHEGLRATTFGRRTDLGWDRVHLARIRRVAGEPVLELRIHEDGRQPSSAPRQRVLLLPVGADLAPLHAFLESRLGRAPYARPVDPRVGD